MKQVINKCWVITVLKVLITELLWTLWGNFWHPSKKAMSTEFHGLGPFWPKTHSVIKSTFYRHADLVDRRKVASETNFAGFQHNLSLYGETLYFLPSIAPVPFLLGKFQGAFPIPQCSVLKPKPSFLPQRALCLGSLSQSAYPELEPLAFENSEALASANLPAGLWSLTAFTNLGRECL